MKRKTQTTPTPKKRRGKRKSTCSSYDRTEYFEDYYKKLKNDPKRLKEKRLKNREWAQTKYGKECLKEYYLTTTKQKRRKIHSKNQQKEIVL